MSDMKDKYEIEAARARFRRECHAAADVLICGVPRSDASVNYSWMIGEVARVIDKKLIDLPQRAADVVREFREKSMASDLYAGLPHLIHGYPANMDDAHKLHARYSFGFDASPNDEGGDILAVFDKQEKKFCGLWQVGKKVKAVDGLGGASLENLVVRELRTEGGNVLPRYVVVTSDNRRWCAATGKALDPNPDVRLTNIFNED